MKKPIVLLLIIVLLNLGTASAQKHEIAFTSGGLKIGEKGFDLPRPGFVKFSTGFTYEFNYARRLLDAKIASLYIEFPFAVTPRTKITSDNVLSPRSYSSFFFTPSAKVKLFPIGKYSPFATIGVGVARLNPSSTRLDNQPNTNASAETDGVFTIGGGLDVKVISHLSLRGEVRDFYSEIPPLNIDALRKRQHNALISAGVVLRF